MIAAKCDQDRAFGEDFSCSLFGKAIVFIIVSGIRNYLATIDNFDVLSSKQFTVEIKI